MSSIGQYLKDTQAELRHVAWPTQAQTIIYTVLVAAISIGVAAYLGLFDFIFTTGLGQLVTNLPAQSPIQVTQQPLASTTQTTPSEQNPLKGSPIQIVPATTTK